MIPGGDTLGVEALAVTVVRSPPVPTVTAPIGTVTAQTVTVTWTYSSPIGRAQAGYRVVLHSQGGVELFDSGLLAGADTSYALGYELSPFSSYRLYVGVSDGLDGAGDPVLVPSAGWAASDFSTEFTATTTSEPRVGSIYEVGVNGVGYMLADHPEQQYRYQRQTVQLNPERLATGNTPFSESIERYTFIPHDSWTGGAGQLYLDRPESDPTRYYYSEWINPFESGELSCLPIPEQHVATTYVNANNCQSAVVAGSAVYVQTGASQLTHQLTEVGAETAFATGLAGTIRDLATDGTYWYATDGATIRRNNVAVNPAADWSLADVTEIEWVGDRLAGLDNVASPAEFVHFSSTGVETVAFTFPGAQLRGICGGDGFVWWGVNRGDSGVINTWKLDATTGSFIALSLPAGETVDNLFFYLGNVFVSTRTTDSRIKIYRCVPTEGRLTPQFIVETSATGQTYPVQFAGNDRFIAFTWCTMHRAFDSGIGVVDLESGGFTRWQAAGGANGIVGWPVSGVVKWQGDFGFVVSTATGSVGGFYGVDATPVLNPGFLETSVSDLATNVTKVLDAVSLTTKPLTGSVQIFYSRDSNGTFVSLGTFSGAGVTSTSMAAAILAPSLGLKMLLIPTGSAGPTVKLLTAKTHVLGLVDQVVVIPVDCADERSGLNKMLTPDSGRGRGRQIARTLDSLCGTNVYFQDVDWPDEPAGNYQVVSCEMVEKAGLYSRHEGKRIQHSVVVVTLRRPLS